MVGNAFYRGLTTEAFPFGCAPHAPAFWDLIPGSDLLNTLNYGYGGDEFGESSEGDHDPERVDDPSLRVVTIAGTKPANFVQRILFAEAWATSNFGRRYGIPEYLNDGAIGIDAARMYGTQSENYTDQGLGLPSITHSASTGSPYFSESSELASVIAQILRGEALQAVANAQGALATTEATSDTMLVDLSIASGSIGVGEIVEQNVQVATTTFLRVFMVSEGARLFLRSPADSLITPGDTLSTPGLQYVYDPILGLEGYLFENPPAGQWTVRIDATGSSGPQEYATAISIASTKAPTVTVEPRPVYDATPVQVLASVRELGTPIPDVTWLCTVIRPDSTTVALTLYDDGAHGDGLGSDGVFGTTFVPAGPIGFYRLEATVTLQDGTTLVTGTAMESAVFQDLATDSTLSFSRNSVIAGDSLQISATIRNLGNNALQGVRVEFWDDATLFAVDSMDIPGGGTDLASATWVAASPDSHTFRVTVNPFTSPPEATYLNNSAFKGIVLGQPIVGVTGSDASRTYLATPWPNPSKGGTTVRFSLAMPGPASLVIYDIAGRRIRSWKWDQLPAGSQTITWDGRTDHGSTAASGVYFVKLVVSGASPTRTVVLLR
ncbi:MAG: T9SS type A sorting domain-containing protein [Candidatus Kerfeldbacteria bacterium]|nr:T9SS type A sorting domain-containing protein [Candidatus Kerfeldbacteria bacterium]